MGDKSDLELVAAFARKLASGKINFMDAEMFVNFSNSKLPKVAESRKILCKKCRKETVNMVVSTDCGDIEKFLCICLECRRIIIVSQKKDS